MLSSPIPARGQDGAAATSTETCTPSTTSPSTRRVYPFVDLGNKYKNSRRWCSVNGYPFRYPRVSRRVFNNLLSIIPTRHIIKSLKPLQRKLFPILSPPSKYGLTRCYTSLEQLLNPVVEHPRTHVCHVPSNGAG